MGCNSSTSAETENQNKPTEKPAEGGDAAETTAAPAEGKPIDKSLNYL